MQSPLWVVYTISLGRVASKRVTTTIFELPFPGVVLLYYSLGQHKTLVCVLVTVLLVFIELFRHLLCVCACVCVCVLGCVRLSNCVCFYFVNLIYNLSCTLQKKLVSSWIFDYLCLCGSERSVCMTFIHMLMITKARTVLWITKVFFTKNIYSLNKRRNAMYNAHYAGIACAGRYLFHTFLYSFLKDLEH